MLYNYLILFPFSISSPLPPPLPLPLHHSSPFPSPVTPYPYDFPSPVPSSFPPSSQHPEGLVYAEVNVKPKPSAKPRVPKPDKTDDRVEYAAIAYQPKDAAEKSPPVVEPTSRRMALPDNPGTCVKCEYRNSIIDHYMQATEGG